MTNKKALDSIHSILEKILEFDEKTALIDPNWGNINFSSVEDDIYRIKQICLLWLNIDISYLPSNTINELNAHLKKIVDSFTLIKNFNIENNAAKSNQSICINIKSYRYLLFQLSAQYVPFIYAMNDNIYPYTENLFRQLSEYKMKHALETNKQQRLEGEFDKLEENVRTLLGETQNSIDELQNQFSKKISAADTQSAEVLSMAEKKLLDVDKKVKDVLQDAKDFADKKAVAPYARFFSDTSKKYAQTSSLWLSATVFFLISTGVWAYIGLVASAPSLSNQAEVIYFFSTRALTTGLLVSAIWWSAKQYRISMHQKTINQHKADALKSFEAFIEATTAPDIRDSVILQTSQAIFGQEQTGYLDKQGNDSFEKYAQVAQSVNNATKIASKT